MSKPKLELSLDLAASEGGVVNRARFAALASQMHGFEEFADTTAFEVTLTVKFGKATNMVQEIQRLKKLPQELQRLPGVADIKELSTRRMPTYQVKMTGALSDCLVLASRVMKIYDDRAEFMDDLQMQPGDAQNFMRWVQATLNDEIDRAPPAIGGS